MEAERRTELPFATDQLVEQFQLGQPLALYNMHLQWIRFCQVIKQVLLGIIICMILFTLVLMTIFLYQYLTLLTQHPANLPDRIVLADQFADLRWRFIISTPALITSLLGCVGCMIGRYMIAQNIPVTLLVCTEGLLEMRPKEVAITHWNEIRGMLKESGSGKRKSYQLARINRKPILFSEVFEDLEGLVNLVRQQINKG